MKIYYQFPLNPFCHLCLFTMMVSRELDVRDENGVIETWAWCANGNCAQRGKRFLIPPLIVEVNAE